MNKNTNKLEKIIIILLFSIIIAIGAYFNIGEENQTGNIVESNKISYEISNNFDILILNVLFYLFVISDFYQNNIIANLSYTFPGNNIFTVSAKHSTQLWRPWHND